MHFGDVIGSVLVNLYIGMLYLSDNYGDFQLFYSKTEMWKLLQAFFLALPK